MFFRLTHTTPESERLILLFAGWGMTPEPLQNVAAEGYDTAVVWNHTRRDDSAWIESLKRYREIVVVGWSYGVNSAARWLSTHPGLPITAKIAINGTLYPVSDTMGIPAAIYRGTLENLSARNIEKFMMRMCGGVKAYKEYGLSQTADSAVRTIEDLREELESFGNADTPCEMWDKAIVSDNDQIIPPGNQRECWHRHALLTLNVPGPHYPDFNALLRMAVTDKRAVGNRFHRAEKTYDANATHQHKVIDHAMELVSGLSLTPGGKLLEIGCGTGLLTEPALRDLSPAEATLIDLHITPQAKEIASQARHNNIKVNIVEADAESAMSSMPEGSLDIVLTASTLQWFNSARAFFKQLARVMRHGATAVITTYGPDTMSEIHDTLGTGNNFPSLEALVKAVNADDLEIIHKDEIHDTLSFTSPLEVLRHVSRTGVNGTETAGSTAAAMKIMRDYPTAPDGSSSVTYHPIYLILRRK